MSLIITKRTGRMRVLVSPDRMELAGETRSQNLGGGGGATALNGGGGGGPIQATTNLLKGDGLGGALSSGIAPNQVVLKSSAPPPTTLNEVIQLLKDAGLCAP